MDNLTHSLVGALLGQAGLKRKTGLAMPALIIGANLPDVDAACFFWLEGVEHLGFRRGITHGPPALALLPLVLAGLLYGFDRWQASRGKRPEGRLPVRFGWLYALAFLGCLTHPALDWLNVYGIRLLEPFSSQWFYGDTLFIIDVWLWALMGFACVFSLRREKRGGEWKRPARVAIAVALAYIGMNGAVSLEQERIAFIHVPDARNFIASPLPLWPLQRESIVQAADGRWMSSSGEGFRAVYPYSYITSQQCKMPDVKAMRSLDDELDAFLFWSRAPFAERAADGSVLLRDARFYDPRARDRFTVALPDVKCDPIPPEPSQR
ncbi:metal-dependent hydrolase [Alteriqipengyuania flavescens]|uniref:metal-dependent hydrolase n=1 Tax=Alteriqipengyuania flavescens TaxID=3053610 RepID=UPI0025B4BBFE|nr:metal-dependent hydrolase [Alteriqipengyuania flavescens]WJY18118.1 metal-dependent hydrolase [Alteriqipengyuania flavescens]WJY24059.1 metal-dependent hydrolase [Alteriqipengyuania flavescens]